MSQETSMLPPNLGLMATSPQAGAQEGCYRLPPAELQAIVDAPRAPALSLSPRRDIAIATRAGIMQDSNEPVSFASGVGL